MGRELHSLEVPFLLCSQWPWVRFLAFPQIYFDVAEIYCRHWFEESGQRLENVGRTHLVLASSKQVLQEKQLSGIVVHTMGLKYRGTNRPHVGR